MKDILELAILIIGSMCLFVCLINSIFLTIDTMKTIKNCKKLDKEIKKELQRLSEDCKNLSENTTK